MEVLKEKTFNCFGVDAVLEFRPNTSDEAVLDQIFSKKEYALDKLPCWDFIRETYENILSRGQKPLIIDGGANIGAATIWFSAMFPEAVIVAVEPAAENVELLRRNIPPKCAFPVVAAIAGTQGQARVFNPRGHHWGYRTESIADGDGESVAMLTIADLFDQAREKHDAVPFIVKLDIEGGETSVFAGECAWLDATPLLIIELHDWLIAGSGDSYRAAMKKRLRPEFRIGENLVSANIPADRTVPLATPQPLPRPSSLGPGPVFVLTSHRSGGTLVARILNCHPDLVIWGEHGGWINKLAEADAIVAAVPMLQEGNKNEHHLRDYAQGNRTDHFEPWTSPFHREEFREVCRNYIRSTFTRFLESNQRWGFKEIRYNTRLTAQFLAELFPRSRFIIVRRNLPDLVVSNMMAPWTLGNPNNIEPEDLAEAVDDCAYALTAVDRGFDGISAALRSRSFDIQYEHVTDMAFAMLDFCELERSGEVEARVAATLATTAGDTPKENVALQYMIHVLATESLARARQAIDRDGIDLARLKRLRGGRYSWVVGDHAWKQSPFSSMF